MLIEAEGVDRAVVGDVAGAGSSLGEDEVVFSVGVDPCQAEHYSIDTLMNMNILHMNVLSIPSIAGVPLADQFTVDIQGEGGGMPHLNADRFVHGGDQLADQIADRGGGEAVDIIEAEAVLPLREESLLILGISGRIQGGIQLLGREIWGM